MSSNSGPPALARIVLGMIVLLLAAGVRAGFGAMVGVVNFTGANTNGNWEDSPSKWGDGR